MDVLEALVRAELDAAPTSLEDWYSRLEALDVKAVSSVGRAALGGAHAPSLGFAFVAGYRAALVCLDSALSRASLCATEQGGAHPRAIQTRLDRDGDGFRLRGEKTFATLAPHARALLVVASVGERDGRNSLQIACIPADRAGVSMETRPPTAFAPEIPHARVRFEDVRVEAAEVWQGDGYETVLKPFRTIEDTHVLAAFLGHVVRLGRTFTEDAAVERALATLASLDRIAAMPPTQPTTHLALAGAFEVARVVAQQMWPDPETQTRWIRDLPLLMVANGVRNARREAAWRAVRGPPGR